MKWEGRAHRSTFLGDPSLDRSCGWPEKDEDGGGRRKFIGQTRRRAAVGEGGDRVRFSTQ